MSQTNSNLTNIVSFVGGQPLIGSGESFENFNPATGEVLGNGNKALKIYSFDQGRIDAAAGGTDLLVFHGSVDAPGVDITLENGTLLNDPGTANVQLGDFRGYVNLPVNNFNLS